MANGVHDVVPDTRSCSFLDSGALARRADVLAGESGRDHVGALDLRPADCGKVTEIGDVREAVCEQARHVKVVVGDPDQACVAVHSSGNSHVETGVSGAQ
jgi:hypothetical protein